MEHKRHDINLSSHQILDFFMEAVLTKTVNRFGVASHLLGQSLQEIQIRE